MLKLHTFALCFLAFSMVGCTGGQSKANYSLSGKTYYQFSYGYPSDSINLSNENYIKFEKTSFTYTSFGEVKDNQSKYKVSGDDIYYANEWSNQRYMILGTLRSNGEVIEMLTGTNGALKGWYATESFLKDVMELTIKK